MADLDALPDLCAPRVTSAYSAVTVLYVRSGAARPWCGTDRRDGPHSPCVLPCSRRHAAREDTFWSASVGDEAFFVGLLALVAQRVHAGRDDSRYRNARLSLFLPRRLRAPDSASACCRGGNIAPSRREGRMNDYDALAARLRRARRDTRIQSVHLNAVESALTLASRDRQFAEMAATTLLCRNPVPKSPSRSPAATRRALVLPRRSPVGHRPRRRQVGQGQTGP